MNNKQGLRQFSAAFMAFALFILPLSIGAQTKISMPKNKYKVSDDVKLGRDAAREAEKQFPLLNDSQVQNYVERVGDNLVDAIPAEFRQPEFQYSFKVVNMKDINAFALPGGPMYVNRGMIEAAKNEGEMAGVMAHEISHVALRHGTAGATKQTSAKSTILGIGAVLGGAILGGETGAAIGQTVFAAYSTKYSREYETSADILGAQIMANAGYDPVDLANMFRTIAAQGGGGGPEFLSSHPNPTNRYARINQEAALLRVNGTPIKNTRDFTNVQARLRGMSPARTSQEVGQNGGNGNQNTGTYTATVQSPSTRTRNYNAGVVSFNVPQNWEQSASGNSATFAPTGANGAEGITHGAMVGTENANSTNLNTATRNYLATLVQSNSYLRQSGSSTRATVDGRAALATTLTGTSPITRKAENVTIYTTVLSDGNLLYMAFVTPSANSSAYNRAFTSILQSVQIND